MESGYGLCEENVLPSEPWLGRFWLCTGLVHPSIQRDKKTYVSDSVGRATAKASTPTATWAWFTALGRSVIFNPSTHSVARTRSEVNCQFTLQSRDETPTTKCPISSNSFTLTALQPIPQIQIQMPTHYNFNANGIQDLVGPAPHHMSCATP